jgi:hypothetical protein
MDPKGTEVKARGVLSRKKLRRTRDATNTCARHPDSGDDPEGGEELGFKQTPR